MGTGSDSGSDLNGWGRARAVVLKAAVLIGGAILFKWLSKSTTLWDHARIVADSLTGEKYTREQASRDPDNFFNIRMLTCPAAEMVDGSKVLYLEQAFWRTPQRPFRQRFFMVKPCPKELKCDVEVNNAGVNFNMGSDNSIEHAKPVITTNYHGTKHMIKAMIPLMRPSTAGARIVNVSSRLGKLDGRHNRIEDSTLKEQLGDLDTLSEELIDRTVSTFLEQVEDGTWESGGWPQRNTDYSMSKLAVNAYTRLLAKELSERQEGEKLYINCFCPGWVKTAMTGWAGNISAENGADTGVWLALLPEAISGKFFAERREISF